MSSRGRRGRGRGRSSVRRLTQQIASLKSEMRSQDSGRFAKKSSCIRLPPYEQTPKIFRKVRLQHTGTSADWTVQLSSVHAAIRPKAGRLLDRHLA